MDILESESLISSLEEKLSSISVDDFDKYKEITKEIENIRKEAYSNLSAWDRVTIARSAKRPKAMDYIENLFTDFMEFHGDYYFGDDASIIAGIGRFEDIPVTILAQAKGKNVEENISRNFGSTNPEGFRKTLRLAKEANKFKRPIITIVDTSGAFPGRGAEERGQSRAIAENLMEFFSFEVPIIAIVIGEGGSGGALALSIANKIIMLENAVYSILTPEGFSAILYKDSSRIKEVAEKMRLTSFDLKNEGIVDNIIDEPFGGAQNDFFKVIDAIRKVLSEDLTKLLKMSKKELMESRYQKFRKIGQKNE